QLAASRRFLEHAPNIPRTRATPSHTSPSHDASVPKPIPSADDHLKTSTTRMPISEPQHHTRACQDTAMGARRQTPADVAPAAAHARPNLAAALRWPGHDIDVLRESWPDAAGPPRDIFGPAMPFDPELDLEAWLAGVHTRYLGAWHDATAPSPSDISAIDLI